MMGQGGADFVNDGKMAEPKNMASAQGKQFRILYFQLSSPHRELLLFLVLKA